MAQLHIELDQEKLEALQKYAERKQTPVSSLIKGYIEYLLIGGTPVQPTSADKEEFAELLAMTQAGGAFDWLAEEEDIYSLDDGEPV